MKIKFALLLALLVAITFPAAARADGIIIPLPPPCDPACPPPPCPGPRPCPTPSPMSQLVIRNHKVSVEIKDQVATTHVDQVFYNPNSWAVEGTYTFPLPPDAVVSSFTLWVDGKAVQGQVLDAKQARRKYEEIVSSLRDPALLEYVGRGAVQASIFPIPSQGERRVELEYTQALAAENGLLRYVYPLNTEKFSAQPLEKVSISVQASAAVPLRAVYSPSHSVDVNRLDDYHLTAGYEAENVLPDNDFTLYISLGEEQAFHLLTYRDPTDATDPDGFFLLLLAPRPMAAQQTIPKDVILVLDRSGSMDGEKFRQAQDALRYILKRLNPQDRFNAIAFSTGLESFARELQPASQANAALEWVDRLSAQGSTDINRALLEAAAIASRERPTYLIFLTDGLPTEGIVDSQKILDNFSANAPANLRLFPFGVGFDVDTFLLDSLAQGHHGTSTYVLPGERLDEALSAFYTKISTPVLTDLALDFGTLSTYDLYPSPLPDLFAGSQLILVGRYRQGGSTNVRLSGSVNGETQTFDFPEQNFSLESPASDRQSSLPRLWATRKIGHLLNQIRLKGVNQELVDQIVHLSIRYGIVTPYTSYLVTEPMPLGVSEQERIAREQYGQMQAAPSEAPSGAAAVSKAAEQGDMAAAQAPAAPAQEAANLVRFAGTHTFIWNNDQWTDTAFDPQTMQTEQVAFLSPEYFNLIEARPDLAAAFALGQRVIVLSGKIAYEVVPSGSVTRPAAVPPTATPANIAPIDTPTIPADSSAPTSTPGSPIVISTDIPSATASPASPSLPCLGGLLPLLVVAVWVIARSRL